MNKQLREQIAKLLYFKGDIPPEDSFAYMTWKDGGPSKQYWYERADQILSLVQSHYKNYVEKKNE